MKCKVFNILILLALFSLGGSAQNKPAWFDAVEKTIAQKETKWKIIIKIESGDVSFFTESMTLESAKMTAAIQITDYIELSNPEETFDGQVVAFDGTMGKIMARSVLKNFGDVGFIWTNPRRGGYTMIKFRKEKIFVNVFAPSEKIARRFAQYVAEQMP